MTQAAPTLSVLLPVRNGSDTLAEAVNSVLEQSYADFELLLIDDGSSDGTPDVVRALAVDPRVRAVRLDGVGLAAALNEGLGLARGRYVARQDADDVSLPGRFAAQVRILDDDPEIAVIGTDYYACYEGHPPHARYRMPEHPAAVAWRLLFTNPFGHTTVMFRHSVIRDAGGYDPAFQVSQDYDLWERVGRDHAMANVAEPLAIWTQSVEGVSARRRDEQLAASETVSTRALARWLEESRQPAGDAESIVHLHRFGSRQFGRLPPASLTRTGTAYWRLAVRFSNERGVGEAARGAVMREAGADLLHATRFAAATRQVRDLATLLMLLLAATPWRRSPVVLADVAAHLVLGPKATERSLVMLRQMRASRWAAREEAAAIR